MKSIKTKIFFIVLSGIIASSVIIGGFGIFWSNNAIKQNSAQILDLMAQAQAEGLNSIFKDVEKASDALSHYVETELDDLLVLHDEENFSRYMAKITDISFYVANCTDSVFSVFVRFAPELTKKVDGVLWKRENGEFLQDSVSEFPVYNSDFENSWYYKARMKGTGVWTLPYYDDDLNEYVVSYALPVYKNGKFFAVVGMNIDFDDIASVVNSISVYDSGFAFLTDEDFVIVYHRKLPLGTRIFEQANNFEKIEINGIESEFYQYKKNGRLFKMLYKNLKNGLRLVVSVPAHEIDRTRTRLIVTIIFSVILISVLVSLWSVFMSNRLTRPLKELTDSSNLIVAGIYDLDFKHHPDDEIGDLMDTFSFMAKSLKVQFNYINNLVYYDSMTGAQNKRAFIDIRNEFNSKIQKDEEKSLRFAVVVFDVNNLKTMNDTYGHKIGDLLIKSACNLITKNFSESPIFRIGGDEFVAVLTGKDYENRTELLTNLRADMDCPVPEKNEGFEKVSIAAGISTYNPKRDTNFQAVFERADEDMYKTKVEMKGGKENVR